MTKQSSGTWIRRGWAWVILCSLFWAACGGGQQTVRREVRGGNARVASAPRESAVGTRLWGYAVGPDNSRVEGVTVGTVPTTSHAVTDMDGFWEITQNLSPGRFKIVGRHNQTREIGTVVTEVEVLLGKENVEAIVVKLGSAVEWPWPEDSILPTVPKMPAQCYPRCRN